MSRPPAIAPRESALLATVEGARLLAQVCCRLPVGFWQRRLAARAFSLSVLPPIDRHDTRLASSWRLDHGVPVFVLATRVAVWGLTPRTGDDPDRVVRALQDAALRPFTAAITLAPPGVRRPAPPPAGRRPPLRLAHGVQGSLLWADAVAILREAAAAPGDARRAEQCGHAADQLVALARSVAAASALSDHERRITVPSPSCTVATPWPPVSG